jgi:hypothetical protein
VNRKYLALAGFVILGLSPSFMDWTQSPDARSHAKFIGYYSIAIALIYYGIIKA